MVKEVPGQAQGAPGLRRGQIMRAQKWDLAATNNVIIMQSVNNWTEIWWNYREMKYLWLLGESFRCKKQHISLLRELKILLFLQSPSNFWSWEFFWLLFHLKFSPEFTWPSAHQSSRNSKFLKMEFWSKIMLYNSSSLTYWRLAFILTFSTYRSKSSVFCDYWNLGSKN